MVPRRGVRSYLAMDDDAKRIARRALDEALAAGKGYMQQTEAAVRAVRVARPELTAPAALAVVNLVRRS